MFEDRRWILVLAVALVSLMGWWTWMLSSGRAGYLATVDAAEDGAPVILSLVTVRGVDADGFDVDKGTLAVRVNGPADVRVGDSVTVAGMYRTADGSVDASWVEGHPGRARKKQLGYGGLAFLAVMAPVWFRRREGGIALRG